MPQHKTNKEMKHSVGTRVQVTSATDETTDLTFMQKIGVVDSHNSNRQTGNTKKDPLHNILFDDGTIEPFWYEELTPLKTATERIYNTFTPEQ